MRLHYARTSPYVRKVMVAASELGVADRLELLTTTRETIEDDVSADNPLAQIPTLLTDDGTPVYDSLNIIDYLNRLAGGDLLPEDGPARWSVLRTHTIGHAIIDVGIFWFSTAGRRVPGKLDNRMLRALDALDDQSAELSRQFTAGEITVACGLGYLDFRLPDFAWRRGRAALATLFEQWVQRPSMISTAPEAIQVEPA